MGSVQTRLEGRWDKMKGRVKETWGDVTDDEWQQTEGKWDRVVGTIKEKSGESQESIERKLNDLLDRPDGNGDIR